MKEHSVSDVNSMCDSDEVESDVLRLAGRRAAQNWLLARFGCAPVNPLLLLRAHFLLRLPKRIECAFAGSLGRLARRKSRPSGGRVASGENIGARTRWLEGQTNLRPGGLVDQTAEG